MNETDLISAEYRELNKRLHEERPDYGTSAYKWAGRVADLCKRFSARTVLDYGCGKRLLELGLKEFFCDAPVLEVFNYDPALPEYANGKRNADIVACIDVLEHIEPDKLDSVLQDIGAHMGSAAFLLVATRPAKKTLADGRNAHLIVKPYSWWLQKLMTRFRLLAFENHDSQHFLAVIDHAKTPTSSAQQCNGERDDCCSVAVSRTGTDG